MLNIGVLVSGGGTNLQKLIDAQQAGEIVGGQLRVVISSRPMWIPTARLSLTH